MGELVLVGLVFLVLWLLSSLIWPYTQCRQCHGERRFRSPSGKHWRECPVCGGSGKRRRLLSHLRRDL